MKKNLIICATILLVAGMFVFLGGKTAASRVVFASGGQDELTKAKDISRDVLRGRAAQRAIGNPDEFRVSKIKIDELKMAHTRFQQMVGDVPVWEGEAIVHLNPDGTTAAVTDDLKESIAVNTQANLSDKDAVQAAKKFYKGSSRLTAEPTADLWVFRSDDRDHLVYRVQMRREDGSKDTALPVYFIDAQTGEKVFYYNNLQTATGSGSSLYSGTISFDTYLNGSTYYMEDIGRKVGTFDYRNTTTSVYRFTDTDNVWSATTQRAADDAHYGAEKVYDYYLNTHGRRGIDAAGGPAYYTSADGATGLISSIVHYSTGYNNAYWNGSYMTYGDGDGTNFTPLTTLDICGHEMTHGVTERTANLTYAGESGALNESMSDVMGTMVERYARPSTWNWKIGEDAYTPGTAGDALRYMDTPNRSGDPDHYSLRVYQGACTPSDANDSCGVHTNSNITNHAFYLIAAGGTNRVSGVSVTGIGPDNAAKIWYRALTVYMTASTNFAGARTATLSAATDLFGSTSTQYNSVATGWCAVGVGSCPAGGGTPTPTPPPTGSELISNGGFETSASPWVGSGTGYFYTNAGSYPHGGTGYIYFGVNNSVSGQAYQQVTIPSTATGTLTFWLNVTSSETGTTAYDNLYVEVRNTAGTLLSTLATYSNVNKGTAGVYSQKSFSLAAYKGQTVRVQFRSTTDASVTTSFRVDDVSLK